MYSGNNFDRREPSTLRAAVSGGLNTAASDLMTPLEDSPNMNNVQVDSDGMIRKRKGYKTLLRRNAASSSYLRGSFLIPIKNSKGRPLLLRKEGIHVAVDVKQIDGSWTTPLQLSNVFPSGAVNTQFSYAKLEETLFNRIVLVGAGCVPIQLSYVSFHTSFTRGSSGDTWNGISTPVSFATSTSGTTILLIDGVVAPIFSMLNSYGVLDNTLSVTTFNSYPAGTYEMEFIHISFQWWAESLILSGEQLVQTVIQGTSTKTVSVPSVLLNGIASHAIHRYPLLALSSTNYDAVFTLPASSIATTASQYAFSNGADSDGTTIPPSSPYYLAFGAAPANARNVHITRGYLLPFNGGLISSAAGDLSVTPYESGTEFGRYSTVPPSEGGAGTGGVGASYHLRSGTTFGVSTTVSTTPGYFFITLDGTRTLNGGLSQIRSSETYFIVCTDETRLETAGYLGTSATSTAMPSYSKSLATEAPPLPANGHAFPVGGISYFANYRYGSFPSVIGTLQGRLVLGGFRDKPLTLVFSNPYDSDVPGYFRNNFDTINSIVSPVSPFDITLPGGNNDIITAMLEFNDSLFVFTRHRVYRIHNNGNPVDFSSAKYTLVAEIGCQNARSVTLTDQFPVFLATSGVYALAPSDTSSGYAVQELSAKIRNHILQNNSELPYTGFVIFDSGRSELYVGLSSEGVVDRCKDLMIMNTQLGVWYRYTRMGGAGFGAGWGAIVYDSQLDNIETFPSVMFTVYADVSSGVPDEDDIMVVELNQDCPFDIHETITGTNFVIPYNTATFISVSDDTTVSTLREYSVDDFSEKGESAFEMAPIISLEDVAVTVDSITQVWGTDFFKTVNGTIRLSGNPSAPEVFEGTPLMRYNGVAYNPVGIRINGKIVSPTLYTVVTSGNVYRITDIDFTVNANDVIDIGYVYPCWYVTPTFNKETLNVKRVRSYTGYYHKTSDIWTSRDDYFEVDDVGQRKIPSSVDIAIIFSNEGDGLLQEEIYNEIEPTEQPLNQQRKDYSRITVPIIGNGYNYAIVHHNHSPTSFKLAGYEIEVLPKPGRGYSRSEESLN